MSAFRLFVGLVTVLLVEGSGFYTGLLKLNTFWVRELELLRYVVLGMVLCGLAVTGSGKPQPPVVAQEKKVLRRRDAGAEPDPVLAQLVEGFKKATNDPLTNNDRFKSVEPPKPAEAVKPVEAGVDLMGLQDEAANQKEEEKV